MKQKDIDNQNEGINIVIVGGGSAAWITASYLKNSIPCKVTIIHNGKDEIIGVGESTTPAVSLVAKKAGIPYKDWVRDARATIKYGILFKDFESVGSRWYHLFDDARKDDAQDTAELLLDYRREKPLSSREFNLYHGAQQILFENRLAPSPMNVEATPGYSYHVESAYFGKTLKKHLKGDYQEIIASVSDVITSDGMIEKLILDNGESLKGDLYIDATEFSRTLISNLTTFEPYSDIISDSFIAGVVKQDDSMEHLPYTVVHAHPLGWIWEIDTYERKATGFIYSSLYTTDEEALDAFEQFWDGKLEIEVGPQGFKSGAMKEFAVGNCISTGMAQSFIEPLEATSLATTCMTAFKIAEIYNKFEKWGARESKLLHRYIQKYVYKSRDFVKFHYTLTRRTDSPWWQHWNKQRNPQEFYKFIEPYFANKRYCEKDDSIINHGNFASMIIGFNLETPKFIPKVEKKDLKIPQHDGYLENVDIDRYLQKINQN